MHSKKWRDLVVYSTEILIAIIGLLIIFTWSSIFDSIRNRNLELNEASKSYQFWIKTPMPLYMELYLYNWTNSQEFLRDKTIKPAFNQVGPFVFREVHERNNITWNNNFTVTYNQTRTWYFLSDESVNLSVPITNLNVVLTTVLKVASTESFFKKILLDFLILRYKEKLVVTRAASQWLFEGMKDSLLDFIKQYNPQLVPFDKFGWFYDRNKSSTYDGRFNIKTGEDNIWNLGLIYEWNYHHKTNFFRKECGIVNGTTSEIFAPLNSTANTLSIFLSDFCSSLMLTNSGSAVINGLEGYRFIGGKNIFDNGTEYPEAKCFCSEKCSPSGIRNVTLCRGAPLFISFPHFYLADPIYVNSIEGLKPNKTEHEFYLIIDQLSGLPLEVKAQLQVNVLLEPSSIIPMFSNMPKIYVPMMWFRQTIKLSKSLESLGVMLQFLKKLGYDVGCVLIVVGLLLIGIKVVKQFSNFTAASDTSQLLEKQEKEESESSSDDKN